MYILKRIIIFIIEGFITVLNIMQIRLTIFFRVSLNNIKIFFIIKELFLNTRCKIIIFRKINICIILLNLRASTAMIINKFCIKIHILFHN